MSTPSVTVQWQCPLCLKPSSITITRDQAQRLEQWLQQSKPGFIQDAFGDLSADQREFLINGSHSECFDAAFPEEQTP